MSDLHRTLRVALRHIDDRSTTEQERESILATIATSSNSREAEEAARALHHMRVQRRHQFVLRDLMEEGPQVAPAIFIGRQDGCGVMPDFDLYRLTKDVPGYCEGSCVSADTLRKIGYQLPPKPEQKP